MNNNYGKLRICELCETQSNYTFDLLGHVICLHCLENIGSRAVRNSFIPIELKKLLSKINFNDFNSSLEEEKRFILKLLVNYIKRNLLTNCNYSYEDFLFVRYLERGGLKFLREFINFAYWLDANCYDERLIIYALDEYFSNKKFI